MPRATLPPRTLSPRQRYTLFRLRTPNPLVRQRKAYTHIYKTTAPHNRETHFRKLREEAEEKELEKGRPLLKRYLYLTEEERKAVDERVREVRRRGVEDVEIENMIAAGGKTGEKVVVTKAPKGGLKGRVGVIRGVDNMGVARVGELEGGEEEHLIPLTHLLPIRHLDGQDTIITPNRPLRSFIRTQRKEVSRQHIKVHKARINNGLYQTDPKQQHDIDTLPDVVEQSSWKPDLLRPPIPESIIDELRGKYSSDRTRWIDQDLGQSQPPEWWPEWRASKMGRRAAKSASMEEDESEWMDVEDGYEVREIFDDADPTSAASTNGKETKQRTSRRETKRLERESLLRIGNVMAELSLKEQKERERAERMSGKSKDMPSEEVLEFLGRAMARAGVTVPDLSTSSNTPTLPLKTTTNKSVYQIENSLGTSTFKEPAVKAREADAIVRRSRKEAREQSAMYWPVKGWKEKQRLQARQALSKKEIEEKKREIVKQMVPRNPGSPTRGGQEIRV